MTDPPRAKTADEVRDEVLAHFLFLVEYWAEESQDTTTREKLEGLLHSVLAMLEGGVKGLPAFDLVVTDSPHNIEYYQRTGRNWYAKGTVLDKLMLHELRRKYLESR